MMQETHNNKYMRKITRCSVALLLSLSGTLTARPFTDVNGRIIEAEYVSLVDGLVTINRSGQAFSVPLDRFSKADQEFIGAQAAKTSSMTVAAAKGTGNSQVNGQELKRNGAITLVEAPLTTDTLKKTQKFKDVTGIKIGIALPENFDPAMPQKVLWVSAPINSEAERTKGNIAALRGYSGTAIAEGWMVIAVDCNMGNPRRDDKEPDITDLPINHQAIAMLSAAWPGFAKSTFVCAGFSGGSKASFYRVGQLLTAGLNVTGLFLGGCNEDKTEFAKKETNVRSDDLRKVNVFMSNGQSDKVASVAAGKNVAAKVDKAFGKVRSETFDGGHSLSHEQLKSALTWFQETGKSSGK